MQRKPINQVFADNLAALMSKRGINQSELSVLSKVSQKTVSNYLNPQQRTTGSKGKVPSAKLAELEMIADALKVDCWQLLRPLDADQRKAYDALEIAFKALQPKQPSVSSPALVEHTKSPRVANGKG